jgi:hypothetical protein
MTERTFTQSEIQRIRKGEQPLHPAERVALEAQQKRESGAARAKRDQVNLELAGKRWDRFRAKIRRQDREAAEQRQLEADALRAMSPMELFAFQKRVPVPVELAPKLPPMAQIAREDNRREDEQAANRERERRERDLGVPQAQAAWTAEDQAISDTRAAVREQCRQIERDAEDAAREARERLGPPPSLESLEAIV